MVQVTLCASSLGYLFPQDETQDLRLHSAFKHAVNLYSDAGTFITLLCAQTYLNLPDAARVWLPECWDWRREIAHSDPIQLTPGLLRTPRFCVALDNATLWQSPFVGGMLTLEAFPLVFQHYPTMASQRLLFCLEHNVQSTLHLPDSLTHQGLAIMEHPDALERQVPQLTICWAIWQRSGYGNSLHHLPIINTGCSRQLINMRTTPRISVVIIWSVRFRDIFQNRFASYSHNWLGAHRQ